MSHDWQSPSHTYYKIPDPSATSFIIANVVVLISIASIVVYSKRHPSDRLKTLIKLMAAAATANIENQNKTRKQTLIHRWAQNPPHSGPTQHCDILRRLLWLLKLLQWQMWDEKDRERCERTAAEGVFLLRTRYSRKLTLRNEVHFVSELAVAKKNKSFFKSSWKK